jgi:hypothetical protein
MGAFHAQSGQPPARCARMPQFCHSSQRAGLPNSFPRFSVLLKCIV